MSQKLLNVHQSGFSALQHVGSKGVAKGVGSDVGVKACSLDIVLDDKPKALAG